MIRPTLFCALGLASEIRLVLRSHQGSQFTDPYLKSNLETIAMFVQRTLVVLASIFLLASAGFSQLGSGKSTPTGDARVKRALDTTSLKYTVDSDGDYRLNMDVGDDRTQIVFINSNTETYADFEIREIWSVGYQSSNLFSATIANKLLLNNELTKLGAWQIKTLNGKYTAVFCAKVSATLTGTELQNVLRAIYTNADKIELELTNKDDF